MLNIVALHEDFNPESAKKVINAIGEFVRNGEKEIWISIDSNGGYVDSLQEILDEMDRVRKKFKCKVNTYNAKKAFSCGALLLSQGDKRICSPSASTMIHEVACGLEGKIDELEEAVKEVREINEKYMNLLVKKLRINRKKLDKYLAEAENRDWFFNATKALEIGIVDEIGYL